MPATQEQNINLEEIMEKLQIKKYEKRMISQHNKRGMVMRYIITRENEFTANEIMERFDGQLSMATVRDAIFYLSCVELVRMVGIVKIYRVVREK